MKQKKFLLTGLLTFAIASQTFAGSKIQIIHNAADPAAAVVDVYLGPALIIDDLCSCR